MQDIVSSSHIFVLLHVLKVCVCYCCLSCKLQQVWGKTAQWSRIGAWHREEAPRQVCPPAPHAGNTPGHGSQVTGELPADLMASPTLQASLLHSPSLCAACVSPPVRTSERLEQVRGGVAEDRVSSACPGLTVSSVQRSGFRGWGARDADWPGAGMARPLCSGSKLMSECLSLSHHPISKCLALIPEPGMLDSSAPQLRPCLVEGTLFGRREAGGRDDGRC